MVLYWGKAQRQLSQFMNTQLCLWFFYIVHYLQRELGSQLTGSCATWTVICSDTFEKKVSPFLILTTWCICSSDDFKQQSRETEKTIFTKTVEENPGDTSLQAFFQPYQLSALTSPKVSYNQRKKDCLHCYSVFTSDQRNLIRHY